jgi:PAS domain S-box-containing protein
LIEAVADVVLVLDRDGRYLKVSTNAGGLYLPPAELLGRRLHDVFPRFQADVFQAAIHRALDEFRVVELEYTLAIRGQDICFDASVAPIAEDRVIWVARDVSARRTAERALREAEEGLRQAARMETIGRLAGSLAHDLNNLLTGIGGYTDLALDEVDASLPLAADLREIRSATKRASDLSMQLLAFSRGQQLRLGRLDVNDTVAGLEGLLRCLTGERITLRISRGDGVPPVWADRGQIERVIVNLVANARDAMPEGGVLEIRTADGERGVTLSVSDSGTGIPAEILPHVFEPFFSTKQAGRGTGLGLWSVATIVGQAGGQVTVRSSPDQGSTFTLHFPEHRDDQDDAPPAPEDGLSIADCGGSETILLVEDDPNLRTVIARMLQRFGFNVLTAGNGIEALALAEARTQAIDLLLTDVVMPELDGPELVERLAGRGIGLRVIYMSGYSDQAVLRRITPSPTTQLLRKPFTLEALLSTVRKTLDS